MNTMFRPAQATISRVAGCLATLLLSAHLPALGAGQGDLEAWLSYQRPAEYEALVTEVRPVMRDGKTLDCKMAVPAIAGEPAPGTFPGVINNVNPYAMLEFFFVNMIEELATLGYQGLTCRIRGSGSSDGHFSTHGTQAEWNDSYDLVEWLAAQPGSNGRIGQEGASYGGMTSLQAAIMKAPHLVTIAPQVPPGDLYVDYIYRGGIKSRRYTAGNWPIVTSLMNFPDMSPWEIWGNWDAHPTLDAFWKSAAPVYRAGEIDIPVFNTPGWADDVLLQGGIDIHRAMVENGKADLSWLFVGEWDHDMAVFPRNVVIAWFDHWLQQRADAPLPPSHVTSHEMGPGGGLKSFDSWPPKGTRTQVFALRADGRLAAEPGDANTASFNQGPWSGLFGDPEGILFATAPLQREMILAGDIRLEVVSAYSGPQANLRARLIENHNGERSLVKEGQLNLELRDSLSQHSSLPVNERVSATVALGPIHRRIASGSSLELEISGVDTWDWKAPSSTVATHVATGKGGSRLVVEVLASGD